MLRVWSNRDDLLRGSNGGEGQREEVGRRRGADNPSLSKEGRMQIEGAILDQAPHLLNTASFPMPPLTWVMTSSWVSFFTHAEISPGKEESRQTGALWISPNTCGDGSGSGSESGSGPRQTSVQALHQAAAS